MREIKGQSIATAGNMREEENEGDFVTNSRQ